MPSRTSTRPSVQAPMEFRSLLQQELIERCRKNPSYSLRSFARALGVQAPTLSHLLRGKRPLTPKQIRKLGQALALSPGDIERFVSADAAGGGKGTVLQALAT